MAKDINKKKDRKSKKGLGRGTDDNFEMSDLNEEKSSNLSTIFVTLAILIIWLALFAIAIKLDFGGFGSTVLQPVLKDVPILNQLLPNTEERVSSDYPYATIPEAVAQIKKLETELLEAQAAAKDDDELVAELQAEVERLRVFEQYQVELENQKAKFYEDVVFNENAPDPSEYIAYYESIDPENAEKLYKEAVQQEQYSKEVQDYASAYSSMKPAQAAKIFEAMVDDLQLAAQILENMSADSRGKILGAMDPDIASRITKIMEP